ncbi:Receptor-like protein 2 [Morella rubra]|uniref:Receptor-like protein 2 n=1 Tax=Morella rubra TaxID=262757 RepID=A0A6A1WP60_9ROSI|nr:Receptor-like protein 2 [Morella rubra]
MNKLKILDLSYNHLVGDISSIMLSNVSSHGWRASIEMLDISSNRFIGEIQSVFIQHAWKLTVLNVSHNSFTGPLPSSLCNNSFSILHLDFSFNHHSGQIPVGLGGCSKLKTFWAGFNSLVGPLPIDLYSAASLEEISLRYNFQLSGLIGDDIINLTKLNKLDLCGNNFSGKLPINIGKLSQLKHLVLRRNSFQGALPPSLFNCTNLYKLDLAINSFEGEISTLNFSNLHKLAVIDLLSNHFTGNFPTSLCMNLYSCKSLRAIRLTCNPLNVDIRSDVVQLNFLSFLSLGYNGLTNITATIKILGHCKALKVLILTGNFLQEAMPANDSIVGLSGFENLRFLSLGDCQLSGRIPLWLSKIKNLEVLSLGSNRISGSIPGWFSTLARLFNLDLSDNLISGEFPKDLCALPALVSPQTLADHNSLDLAIYGSRSNGGSEYNSLFQFGGAICIANNNLSGIIPIEIGRLKQLRNLELNDNNLSGKIPFQISELTHLEVLDLSENHFSGEIPASLANLHFLNNFSVANNKLYGAIPSGTQLQTFDASAYEGNPGLCGPPLLNECAHISGNKGDKDIIVRIMCPR